MTVLGKILVGLNFVFSLVAASLFVMSYAARTNWKNSYDKLESEYKVAAGSADAYAYILESLKHYPAQQGVAAKMRELGLENVRIVNLLGGVMSINYGEKR